MGDMLNSSNSFLCKGIRVRKDFLIFKWGFLQQYYLDPKIVVRK